MMSGKGMPLVYLAFGLTIGAVIGAIGASFHPELQWLERWQALLTGLLAVSAAVLTVWQMRVTDEEQQTRHAEVISLALRPDRARAFAVGQRADYFLRLAHNAPQRPYPTGDDALDARNIKATCTALLRWFQDILTEFNQPNFLSAADLFDESLIANIEEVTDCIRSGTPFLEVNAAGQNDDALREATRVYQEAEARCSLASTLLHAISGQIRELSTRYKKVQA